MAKKKPNNFQWDGEFQSKPKHNPKPGKQSSSGKPSGKPATQHPQNKPAPPKRNLSNQSSAQPAPTPSSPRGGKPNSRYKPQLRAVPVEMYVAAAGNPLAQSLLMTLQDEGKPEDMTNEKFLYRFARYGWNHNETLQGQSMLHLWQTNQSTTSEDELLALYNAKLSALLGTISTTTSEFLRDTLSVKYNSMLVNTDEIVLTPLNWTQG